MTQCRFALIFLLVGMLSIAYAQTSAPNPGLYTILDLKTLETAQDYKEFFAHAKDIRPSERDENWQNMVQNMGYNYIKELSKNTEITKSMLIEMENIFNWSELKSFEMFRMSRAQFGKRYFTSCLDKLSELETCLVEMQNYFAKDSQNTELALEFGTLLSKLDDKLSLGDKARLSQSTDPWIYYQLIAKSELSEFYCGKEYFFTPLQNQLRAMIRATQTPEELNKKIHTSFHRDCLKQIIPIYENEMISHSLAPRRDEAFAILRSLNKLTLETKSQYLTLYLLDSAQTGPTMEMAWKELASLGANYEKREKTLSEIKKMDPLPGKIFINYQESRIQVLLKHLNRQFPEYIDLYANTCLKYLKGQESFPHGNPTPECHDFFKAAHTLNLVPPTQIKHYQDATRF